MTDPSRVPQTHRIILVRHARSRVDQARNPREWGLTEEGAAAAGRLSALALFEHAAGFYAGSEPKMVQTLEPVAGALGRRVTAEAAFGETASEGVWAGEEAFQATVRRLFEAPAAATQPGWETAAAAVVRFGAAVERLREVHEPTLYPGHALPGTFAISSGGRMLTAYLAHLLGYTPEQAFTAWRALRMPDVGVLELSVSAPPQMVIPFGTLTV